MSDTAVWACYYYWCSNSSQMLRDVTMLALSEGLTKCAEQLSNLMLRSSSISCWLFTTKHNRFSHDPCIGNAEAIVPVQMCRADVSTYCFGLAASMGAFLLTAGTKGKRFSMPNARIMIHQPLGGASGQAVDIEIQAKEIMYHKGNLNQIMSDCTGQPIDRVNIIVSIKAWKQQKSGPARNMHSLLGRHGAQHGVKSSPLVVSWGAQTARTCWCQPPGR